MKKVNLFGVILTVLLVTGSIIAQQKGDNGSVSGSIYDPSPQLQRQMERDIRNGKQTTLDKLARSEPYYLRRNQPLSNAERRELKENEKRIKARLTPNPADLIKYKDFLKQPDTGIFRLFPDFDCEQKNVINAGGNCEDFIPGTSSYSFRQNDYPSNLSFFDIKLKDSHLISNGFLTQGILTELGDVALENISPADERLSFLIGFKPETESQKVKDQYARIADGIHFNGFNYTKKSEAKKDTTYALRVIAYHPQRKIMSNNSVTDRRFIWLVRDGTMDKRVDLTLAFRIIREETDGSVTIVWKQLNRQKSPEITFPKNEIVSDIGSN